MKIRRYMGKDIQEAMLKVKTDLGSDAIILNTRKIKQKGFFNIFSKPLIEVLAAIDEVTEQPVAGNTSAKVRKSNVVYPKKVKPEDATTAQKYKIEELSNKVNHIEEVLQKIYANMKIQNNSRQSALQSESQPDKFTKIMKIFENNLIANNVEKSIVDEIIEKVRGSLTNQASINEITSKMYSLILEILDKPKTIEIEDDDATKVVIFVGPTGVGKTTTLAKLAAIFSIHHEKKIGIITADTYRIAAVEQLKTYTEILGMPIHVVYSPEEMDFALKKFSDKDLVFIDTAVSSHKDERLFEEVKKIIEISNPDEIFLLISSTTDYKVCQEIVERYSFLDDYKIIITKMDEAATQGIVLNLKKLTNKSLSYVTIGQSVPDDIEVIDTDVIAKKLLGSIQL